jgi:hypothetical protein
MPPKKSSTKNQLIKELNRLNKEQLCERIASQQENLRLLSDRVEHLVREIEMVHELLRENPSSNTRLADGVFKMLDLDRPASSADLRRDLYASDNPDTENESALLNVDAHVRKKVRRDDAQPRPNEPATAEAAHHGAVPVPAGVIKGAQIRAPRPPATRCGRAIRPPIFPDANVPASRHLISRKTIDLVSPTASPATPATPALSESTENLAEHAGQETEVESDDEDDQEGASEIFALVADILGGPAGSGEYLAFLNGWSS